MKDYQLHTFPNGIRFVHKQVQHTKIAHCGFLLDIGSRDEKEHQHGIAHFWEHMAFKGTTKRKAFHILNRLDSVGGELNAYTTKEKICFYASLLDVHVEKAVDLLTDITFSSTFPEKEILKEKSVILEEMSMYEDDPGDAIFDHFDELIFKGHPLGENILGTRASVPTFQQKDFHNFIAENLDTSKIIFSSVSALSFEKMLKMVSKYLEAIPAAGKERERIAPQALEVQSLVQNRHITQAHYLMGGRAPMINDKDRIPLFLLNNLLGGPTMNSRLSLGIREKYGFVYGIESSFASFTDTGVFSIYFATEPKTLNKCIALVEKELKKLRTQKLGTLQLHTAKQQLMGQLAMGEESNQSLMLMMGKSLLDLNKIGSMNNIFEEIKNISADKIIELANNYLDNDRFCRLAYLPEKSN